MADPVSLAKTIKGAADVANTPLIRTVIDRVTGFKLSEWAAEGEVRKKLIHDEYEKAKEQGIMGMQYIEYMRSTENLIETAVKSTKYIDPEKSNDIKMDNDFFWNTIEHAKTVSNDEVQELVAKIIAGEYNDPGTYSMSTLQTLKMLGRKELELFEKVGSLCLNGEQIPNIVFSPSDDLIPIINSLRINFPKFQSLQALGLILPNTMYFTYRNLENKIFQLDYFDKTISFALIKDDKTPFRMPKYYNLSITGTQIIKHLNPSFNADYYNWLRNNLKVENYRLVEN